MCTFEPNLYYKKEGEKTCWTLIRSFALLKFYTSTIFFFAKDWKYHATSKRDSPHERNDRAVWEAKEMNRCVFTFPWPRAVFVPLGLVLFYTSCHFTVPHWIFFCRTMISPCPFIYLLLHHLLTPHVCLHLPQSAMMLCECFERPVQNWLWRHFFSPSLKTVLHIFFYFYSFLDTTKVLLKHAVENKLPARCMSGVSGLSVSVPLQTCRSSEKASLLTSRLNSALFCKRL